MVGTFYEKELQKKEKQLKRAEKVIKRKGDELYENYMLHGKATIILLTVGF